jgi:hypothetical protein
MGSSALADIKLTSEPVPPIAGTERAPGGTVLAYSASMSV